MGAAVVAVAAAVQVAATRTISNSIHSLTRIMLYKVAKLSAQLCQHENFQALTVNLSTIEMIEPNVCLVCLLVPSNLIKALCTKLLKTKKNLSLSDSFLTSLRQRAFLLLLKE